jgi:Tol biopolymer transport system component
VALALGTPLGPYEIIAPIGAGGMGEVYRARDTKLNRVVALKILPDAFALDGDRIARFRREAQVLAALNHPNIAAIYGFEDSGSTHALVLELVEGPTLADRIAKGPIPLDDTLSITKQIAEALEAAHEQGIIHRDLKPGNIKVRDDGTVKVLDFGLAKAMEPTSAISPSLTASPTITTPAQMTGVGMLLGTAAYMSPEQAKGRPADKRSDIWAFGCVLFEMLTGKRVFDGEDVSDTLAVVLTKSPAWDALPQTTPASIRRLLQRSLEKDRKHRLADISDARLEIDEALVPSATGLSAPSGIVGAQLRSGWHTTLPWALAAALSAGLAVALAMWARWPKPSVSSPVRLSAEVGADVTLGVSGAPGANLALSPDGKLLVFAGQRANGVSELYIRRVDQLQATALSGTDDGRDPFFSPDGQWIGFFAGGKLKKMSITGGAALTLCDAANSRGATWGEDGTIVFQPENRAGTSLLRVSDGGGKPEPFTTLANGEGSQRWPQLLPGGKAVLFTTGTPGRFDDGNIVIQPLPVGPRKIVQRGGYYGRVAPSRHLLYIHGGTLFAAPFDLDRLEIAGRPVPVLEGIDTYSGVGGANFAVSDIGTLVYLAGQGVGNEAPMVWLDRTGRTVPLRTTPADWGGPRFSPDGTRLAMDIMGAAGGVSREVWVYDWMRDTPTRLTFGDSLNVGPIWTPNGRRIVFASGRAGGLYWQRADGTGDAQRLTESTASQTPGSWHPNGKVLAFTEMNQQTGNDIKILTVEGDEARGWKPGTPTVFLNGPSDEQDPQFSPDGRWIAYYSNESGQPEVYVRPYPSSVGKWQISTGGGLYPIWSRTRSELFYITPNQHIMVASYMADGGSFTANKAQTWWSGRILGRPRGPYALHPDGNRFAVSIAQDATSKQDHVVFVFNFFEELRRLAPAVK